MPGGRPGLYYCIKDGAGLAPAKKYVNSTRKDCNKCEKTINTMDKLFDELFPNIEEPLKRTRNDIINEATKAMIEV